MAAVGALIDASVRALSVGFLTPEEIERQLRYVVSPDTQLIRDGTYFVAIHPDAGIVAAGGWSRRRALHGGDAYKAHALADADELLVPGREPA
ncbi:MAG TPA: hypothetical protein VLJ83_10190, partial [Gemmatimonadaceae bacterium]|nr:hypothetical protein [Gemmatimonadaceae bacterium]